jgi:hypothetical protein
LVCRAIIYNNYLKVLVSLIQHALDGLIEVCPEIIAGDYDRNLWREICHLLIKAGAFSAYKRPYGVESEIELA